MTATWESLSAVLGGIPAMSQARCAGRWHLWDETELPEVVEYTIGHCLSCPTLSECRNWFESLPRSKRPVGVVAGKVVRKHTKAAA